jgi:hypothetical protein
VIGDPTAKGPTVSGRAHAWPPRPPNPRFPRSPNLPRFDLWLVSRDRLALS